MNSYERIYENIIGEALNVDEATKAQKTLGGLAAVASLGLGSLASLKSGAQPKAVTPVVRVDKKAKTQPSLPSLSRRSPATTDQPSQGEVTSGRGTGRTPFVNQQTTKRKINIEQLKKDMAERRQKRRWEYEYRTAGGTKKTDTVTNHLGQDFHRPLKLNSKGEWERDTSEPLRPQ